MGTAKTGIIGTSAAAAALLLVAGVAPPAGAAPARAAAVEATCPTPFVTSDPVWSTTPGVPAGNTGVVIETIPAPARTQTALDMDDDGTVDTTSVGLDGSVTVQRGDGDLVVTGIPSGYTGFSVTGDDLDGDGRSELVVWRKTGLGQGTRSTTYLVPGTTPPGTVAVADVGASFEGTVTGDVTGDGLDDLFVTIPYILTSIPLGSLSGADVIAALPAASPLAGLDVIALRADLDFDGEVDSVHRGSADGQFLVLSTGTTLSLGAGTDTYAVTAFRTRSRTIVQTVGLTPGLLVTGFELHNTCADAWMRSVTPQVVGRAPVPSDYPTFGPTAEPTQAQRLVRTTALVKTVSARLLLVKGAFDFYLGRAPDPVGQDYWVRALRNGNQTPDSMWATPISSREFLTKRTDGTPGSWVTAVYDKAFGRSPDPSGLAYWTQQASKLGPKRTAARMIASPESRRYRIRAIANSEYVLGGPPETHIVTQGLLDYAAGGFDGFSARLLATDDVYLHAQRRNRVHPA